MRSFARMLCTVLVAPLALAACDDGDAPTDPGDEANFAILLKAEGSPSSTMRRAAAVVPPPLRAVVSLTAVSSIRLPIGLVEARQEGGAWVEAGFVGEDIDLLDLPSDGVELVETSLEEGSYTGLRFYLDDDPTLVLDEEIVVGRTVYEEGEHPLVIPSVDETGLKLNADFVVDDDGEVLTVFFDDDASVRRVIATGSGRLMISPVLRVVDEDDEDVGEIDDDEDDDGEIEFEGFVEAVGSGSVTLTDGTVVLIDDGTRVRGDLFSLGAVAEAVAAGEVVEVEGEGHLAGDGTSVVATEIEFEVADDDGDDDVVEVEGRVTAVDRSDGSLTLTHEGGVLTVVLDAHTAVEGDFDGFGAMADAFDDGQSIEVEAEGELAGDGTLLAYEVEFEVEADEFEGRVIAATGGAVDTFTVLLDGGGTLLVVVTGTTDFHPHGDLGSFGDVSAALDAGAEVEIEGRGTLDETGVLTATRVKVEIDD